jgi:hypothetical protein
MAFGGRLVEKLPRIDPKSMVKLSLGVIISTRHRVIQQYIDTKRDTSPSSKPTDPPSLWFIQSILSS